MSVSLSSDGAQMTNAEPTDVASLAHTYGRRVFHAAWRVLGDVTQAEDVQQEVFLRLLEKSVGEVTAWSGFLTTMATRMAIDRLRRRQRWRRLIPMWHASAPVAVDSTERDAIGADRARLLRQALGRLKSRDAECFALRHLHGMEITAIAQTMHMTPNHVSVCLHRAARALEAQLADSGNPTSPEVL